MISNELTPTSRARHTNRIAIAALICGVGQFGYPLHKGLALFGLAAIILGHIAIRQIRRTGERGYGLAKTGLILGYTLIVGALLLTFFVTLMSS